MRDRRDGCASLVVHASNSGDHLKIIGTISSERNIPKFYAWQQTQVIPAVEIASAIVEAKLGRGYVIVYMTNDT